MADFKAFHRRFSFFDRHSQSSGSWALVGIPTLAAVLFRQGASGASWRHGRAMRLKFVPKSFIFREHAEEKKSSGK